MNVLLGGAEGIAWRSGLLHALILAPAAVFLLMFFDEGREGQFLKATTHWGSRSRQVDSLPVQLDYPESY